MIFGKCIVHANVILVIDTVTALGGLVAIRYALVTERMIGFMLRLTIACAAGKVV